MYNYYSSYFSADILRNLVRYLSNFRLIGKGISITWSIHNFDFSSLFSPFSLCVSHSTRMCCACWTKVDSSYISSSLSVVWYVSLGRNHFYLDLLHGRSHILLLLEKLRFITLSSISEINIIVVIVTSHTVRRSLFLSVLLQQRRAAEAGLWWCCFQGDERRWWLTQHKGMMESKDWWLTHTLGWYMERARVHTNLLAVSSHMCVCARLISALCRLICGGGLCWPEKLR